MRNPTRTNFDTGLFKQFYITERRYFEFRAESFNTFNHTQFNGVNHGISCYGGSNYSAGDTSCLDQSSLHPSGAHNPRILQLGLNLLTGAQPSKWGGCDMIAQIERARYAMRTPRLTLLLLFVASGVARSQPQCSAMPPFASLSVPHVDGQPDLTLDFDGAVWRKGARAEIAKDCSRQINYPQFNTDIRAFWTDADLYLLFRCAYQVLNLFLPAAGDRPRVGLWDRDVVEVFLGDDWRNIRRYREFEIAPTGDWIDLAIDLDRKSYDSSWRSGWRTSARIDGSAQIWYAAARIPLSSVSPAKVEAGTRWRMNLYRIEGLGPDSQRHFLCWQPTCVQGRDPNHVPEHFGTLIFQK